MANRLAAKFEGKPCVKTSAHINAAGKTIRYVNKRNCVLCAHEAAARQTADKKAARQAAEAELATGTLLPNSSDSPGV